MTSPKDTGLTLRQLAYLHQMTVPEMDRLISAPAPKAIDFFKGNFTSSDALEIEIARQMSDNDGIPLNEALRLSLYASAVKSYVTQQAAVSSPHDFWFAVMASRNTWGTAPRGSWPITGFGSNEYWAEMHYSGSLGAIMGEISEWIGRDQANHPDSDPSRIVMCNVSAADRRLRKRAVELGIELDIR